MDTTKKNHFLFKAHVSRDQRNKQEKLGVLKVGQEHQMRSLFMNLKTEDANKNKKGSQIIKEFNED